MLDCPNHAGTLPESCQIMATPFWNHANIMPESCPIHIGIMYKSYGIMAESSLNDAQIMAKSFWNYAHIIVNYPKHVGIIKKHMAKLCCMETQRDRAKTAPIPEFAATVGRTC